MQTCEEYWKEITNGAKEINGDPMPYIARLVEFMAKRIDDQQKQIEELQETNKNMKTWIKENIEFNGYESTDLQARIETLEKLAGIN